MNFFSTPKQALLPALALLAFLLCGCGPAGPAEDGSSPAEPPSSAAEEPLPAPPPPDPAQTLLEAMTTKEKVGQLFFIRCPTENAAEEIAAWNVGGVLLFGRDFRDKTPEEVRAMTVTLQTAAQIPLLIGADEEGGSVVRASSNPRLRPEKFAAPGQIYARGGVEALAADAAEKSAFLLDLGVNVNFAPVADVAENRQSFLYDRTLGADAPATAQGVAAIVTAMEEAKIGSVLKHFPGYGDNGDTHTGAAVDERPYETFVERDFLPFQAGIRAGAGAVLMSHNTVTCMDTLLPASLSERAHHILRRELGFEGVILTDDLDMDAMAEYREQGTAAVLAVLAGNDMLVTGDYAAQIPQVLAAVEEGLISMEQLDSAVLRVLRWKARLGLLDGAAP